MARSSIPKMLECTSLLPLIFGHLVEKKRRKSEFHIKTNHEKKLSIIYARPRVNKDFVHCGSIGLIKGEHARYVIIYINLFKTEGGKLSRGMSLYRSKK